MTYEVMGYRAQSQASDINTDPDTQGTDTRPTLVPIYTTDDMAEVDRILEAGGYVDSAEVFWVAEGYREADNTGESIAKSEIAGATEFPTSPRTAGEPVPENSSATIDASGRVRTDATKRPETPEDVAKIAGANPELRDPKLPFPKKRNILP